MYLPLLFSMLPFRWSINEQLRRQISCFDRSGSKSDLDSRSLVYLLLPVKPTDKAFWPLQLYHIGHLHGIEMIITTTKTKAYLLLSFVLCN